MGLQSRTTPDQHQRNDHPAWSPPPGPARWSAARRQPPRTHLRGSLVSTCSFCAPPALWRRVSSLGRQAASSAPDPVRIPGGGVTGGPALPSTLVRATHCQRWTIPSLPGPIRATTSKPLTDHSDTSKLVREMWPAPPRRCIPGSSAVRTAWMQRPRTPDACLSGHPDRTGRVDTGRLDTGPLRPTSWLDGRPHGGQRTRTERRTAWPTSGHPGRPRRWRPPAGRRNPRSG
jgi:hypothetical protein